MTANDSLVADYLHRAVLRHRTLPYYFEQKSWPDVVRDSRTIVDLAMIAVMFNSNIAVPSDAIALERLSPENVQNIEGISKLLEKERQLSTSAIGSIVPSRYFTEDDARHAMDMTNRVLNLFVPQMAPSLIPLLQVHHQSGPARGLSLARH